MLIATVGGVAVPQLAGIYSEILSDGGTKKAERNRL